MSVHRARRRVIAGARDRLRSSTAASALLAACAWCVPQVAWSQYAPAPSDGGTVACTGNPSGFTASDLGSLTITAENTSFNGAFSVSRIGTLDVTSTNRNFQTVTFTDIGDLDLAISGGNFNGPLTATRTPTGPSSKVVVTSTGNLNNPTFTGINDLTLLINGGNVNGNVTVGAGGIVTLVNRANPGHFELEVSARLDLDNFGTINSGLTVISDAPGMIDVLNAAGATINGDVVSTGSAANTIDNAELINNNIRLGTGNDVVINRTGAAVNYNTRDHTKDTINGEVDLGDGLDQFFMRAGTVNNQILLGAGNNYANVSAGIITRTVRGEDGDDRVLWTGGNIAASPWARVTTLPRFVT